MANKPTLKKIEQIANNEEAAVALFNDNFNTIEEFIKDSVSRSGKIPTNMLDNLDMGSKRIINLGPAVGENDAVRYKDVQDALEESRNAKEFAQKAENAAARANTSAVLANISKGEAQEAAAGAKTSEDNAQMIYDELIINEAVATVHENIADVKTVAENIEDINITADNIEDIEAVFDIAKRIAYGNIGDIRATFAATAPDGCRFADGSVIRREDYPELFEMLDNDGIPFDSVSIWTSNVNAHGITGAFGYDEGSSEAYLPLLTEAFVEATNITPHRVKAAGLPNITGDAAWHLMGQTNNSDNYSGAFVKKVVQSSGFGMNSSGSVGYGPVGIGFDASASNSIYGNSDTVQPKSIMLRHYVVLTNSRQMFLTWRDAVATKNDLPATGNINGDIRVVTNEGVAYVWARTSRDSWMWSSIGRFGTGAGGPAEWGYIEGDMTQQADLQLALDKKVTNLSEQPGAITLLGKPIKLNDQTFNGLNIGVGSTCEKGGDIALGYRAYAGSHYDIAIGAQATSKNTGLANQFTGNVVIGFDAKVAAITTAEAEENRNARKAENVVIGFRSYSDGGANVVLGSEASVTNKSMDGAAEGSGSVALGYRAVVNTDDAVQLGKGTNTVEGSLQFRDYPLVDANGKIPAERLPDEYYRSLDETQKTQLLFDGTYEGSEVVDGEVFTEYDGKFVEYNKELNPGGEIETTDTSHYDICFDETHGYFVSYEYSSTAKRWRYVKSTNGFDWEPLTEYIYGNRDFNSPAFIKYANGFLYSNINSSFSSTTYSYSSNGGITWTLLDSLTGTIAHIAYGNGAYVVQYSDNTAAVSLDGINFEAITYPSSAYGVCFNNGIFIIGGPGTGNYLYKSTDGVSWESVTDLPFRPSGGSLISSARGYFYMVGRDGNSAVSYLYRSVDGTSWEQVSDVNFFGLNGLVTDGTNIILYNPSNSSTISYVLLENDELSTTNNYSGLGTICYGDGLFVSNSERFSFVPFYEHFINPLSYNKDEVDAAYLKNNTTADYAIAAGTGSSAGEAGTAVGNNSGALNYSVSYGYSAEAARMYSVSLGVSSQTAGEYATAIGYNAHAMGEHSIQIGYGNNPDAHTFKVALDQNMNVELLNENGVIPAERLVNAPQPDVSLPATAYAGEGICLLTEPVTDYELVGLGPTIDTDYVATGFSGVHHLTKALDNIELANGAVLEAAFSVSSLTASSILLLSDASNVIVGRIVFNANGTITGAVGSAALTSTSTFAAGQKVYARYVYDTTTVSLYTSTDGKEWTLERSGSLTPSSTPIAGKIATSVLVGRGAAAATIYLPECSLSYQGKEIWRAAEGVGKTGISVDDHLKLLVATTAPSTTTVGHIGQVYVDTATGTGYMCVGVDTVTPAYTWKQITV